MWAEMPLPLKLLPVQCTLLFFNIQQPGWFGWQNVIRCSCTLYKNTWTKKSKFGANFWGANLASVPFQLLFASLVQCTVCMHWFQFRIECIVQYSDWISVHCAALCVALRDEAISAASGLDAPIHFGPHAVFTSIPFSYLSVSTSSLPQTKISKFAKTFHFHFQGSRTAHWATCTSTTMEREPARTRLESGKAPLSFWHSLNNW